MFMTSGYRESACPGRFATGHQTVDVLLKEKTMKRSLLLAALVAVGLTACGKKEETKVVTPPPAPTAPTASPTPPATPTPSPAPGADASSTPGSAASSSSSATGATGSASSTTTPSTPG